MMCRSRGTKLMARKKQQLSKHGIAYTTINSWGHIHEELGTIRVWPLVGHGEEERLIVLELEVLIYRSEKINVVKAV